MYTWSQKVYNLADMVVDIGLDDNSNTLEHEIKPNIYVTKFKSSTKKYEEEWIKKEDKINRTRLLDNYRFIYLINNEDNITYNVDPENLDLKVTSMNKNYWVIRKPLGCKE